MFFFLIFCFNSRTHIRNDMDRNQSMIWSWYISLHIDGIYGLMLVSFIIHSDSLPKSNTFLCFSTLFFVIISITFYHLKLWFAWSSFNSSFVFCSMIKINVCCPHIFDSIITSCGCGLVERVAFSFGHIKSRAWNRRPRLFHDNFLGDVIGFDVFGFGGQHDIIGIQVLLHMCG